MLLIGHSTCIGDSMARHASLADQLTALRAFIEQPETIEPAQTNWQSSPHARPAAFNPEDLADVHVERRVRIRPSIEEISRRLIGVTFETMAGQTRPVGGDIERSETGAVIRMGKIRFSDGTATERAYKTNIDGGVIIYDARLPVGAMIGTRETQERTMGGDEADGDAASNRYFAEMFGVKPRGYRPGGKRRQGRNYTNAESAAMLAEAIANTPVMPTVTMCPDGLACGTARISDQFNGMKKGRSGESGSMQWADIGTALAERDVWALAKQALKDDDKAVLDAVPTASGLRQVGESVGFSGRSAYRNGRVALLAANDNLRASYKKFG